MTSKKARIAALEIEVKMLNRKVSHLDEVLYQALENGRVYRDSNKEQINSIEKFLGIEFYNETTPEKVEQGHRKIVKAKK